MKTEYVYSSRERRNQILDQIHEKEKGKFIRSTLDPSFAADLYHLLDNHDKETTRQFLEFARLYPVNFRKLFSFPDHVKRRSTFRVWSELVWKFKDLSVYIFPLAFTDHAGIFEARLKRTFGDTELPKEVRDSLRVGGTLKGNWSRRLGLILKTDISLASDVARLYLALRLTDDKTDMVEFTESFKDIPMLYLFKMFNSQNNKVKVG